MVVRELITRLGFKVNTDSLKKGNAALQNIKRSAINVGKIVGVGILAFGTAAIKVASDFEETQAKFNTVFSDIQDKANGVAKNLRKNFGLSSKAALDLAGNTGDLLTGLGLTQDQSLSLSENVNKLAVDLASFTNYSGGAEGASAALTKALLGERESAKSLGIVITETMVKERIKQLEATEKVIGMTLLQKKAMATLQIATEQSKNAIGDYARTQDSLANKTRLLKARLEDLTVTVGQRFTPIATKIVTVLVKLIEGPLGELIEVATRVLVPVLETISKVLEVVFNSIKPIIGIFEILIKWINELFGIIKILIPVMSLFNKLFESIEMIFKQLEPEITKLINLFVELLTIIITELSGIGIDVLKSMLNIIVDMIPVIRMVLQLINFVLKAIKPFLPILIKIGFAITTILIALSPIGNALLFIIFSFKVLFRIALGVLKGLKKALAPIIWLLGQELAPVIQFIQKLFGSMKQKSNGPLSFLLMIFEKILNIINKIGQVIGFVFGRVIASTVSAIRKIILFVKNLIDNMNKITMGIAEFVTLLFTNPVEAIKGMWNNLVKFISGILNWIIDQVNIVAKFVSNIPGVKIKIPKINIPGMAPTFKENKKPAPRFPKPDFNLTQNFNGMDPNSPASKSIQNGIEKQIQSALRIELRKLFIAKGY